MPSLAECRYQNDLERLAGEMDVSGDWQDPEKAGAALLNALNQIERLERRVHELERRIESAEREPAI